MRVLPCLLWALISSSASAQTALDIARENPRYVLDAGIPREYLLSFDSLLAATRRYDYLSDECNRDNTVYLPGRTFVFDYYYEKNGKRWKVNNNGHLVDAADTSAQTIIQVGYKIEHGSLVGMTPVRYEYRLQHGVDGLFEAAGIIENPLVTWLHPPRSIFFGRLEVLPFPYFDKNAFRSGQSWHWDLLIGNPAYLSFIKPPVDEINNQCTYTPAGTDTLHLMGVALPCFVVESRAVSEAGTALLKSWYHEQHGFMRLDGINVDGSRWFFELVGVEVW